MKGAISEQHKQFSCWYATFSVSYLHTETQKSTCTHPRYCSPSPITVPYCFHYSQLEQRMKKMLFFFFLKRGEHWKIHETCMGERGSEMTNSDCSKTFYDICVSKCKCVLWVLGWDGVPQGGLLSVLTLRYYTAHPSTLGAISHRLLLPSFPACQASRFKPGIDFWLSIRIFLCPATSSNLANTNFKHKIIDTVGLLANSGVLHSTLDLCGCVSLAFRLFSSELSACRAPVSRGLHHGTLHLSNMHPHTV